MPNTVRLGLPYPSGTQAADGPAQIKALADALDSATPYAQGTLAARPAASPSGKLYYATDAGMLSYANGVSWIDLGPSVIADLSVTTLKLADNSVDAPKIATDAVGSSEIAASAVGNPELADLAVDAGKIAASLKPSGGAAGATEALRALGTASGRAAAGIHATQHNLAGADVAGWSAGVLQDEFSDGTKPYFRSYRSTDQTINDGNWEKITWHGSWLDGAGWDPGAAGNFTDVDIPEPGTYLLILYGTFAGNTTGRVGLRIKHKTADAIPTETIIAQRLWFPDTASSTARYCATAHSFAAGESIGSEAFSGTQNTVLSSGPGVIADHFGRPLFVYFFPSLMAVYLGK